MGTVIAVCSSNVRGIQKTSINSGKFSAEWGLMGDAHGGAWHRQVSLLSADKIEEFNQKGANVTPGAFGENIIVEGIDFRSLPVGTLLRCNDALFEMTQIGKECHSHCQIYHRMGDCIMPREGVFARVVQDGTVSVGDEMTVQRQTEPFPWQAAVITLSDKGFKGEREDKSGPLIVERLKSEGYEIVEQVVLPDERALLEKTLTRLCDQRQLDLILTTGGTGFNRRDITPEATIAVSDRQAPGIAEAIRAASMAITPRAMLSRGASVIRGKTLIINLPGSPKACAESMDVFLSALPHGLELLRGEGGECAVP